VIPALRRPGDSERQTVSRTHRVCRTVRRSRLLAPLESKPCASYFIWFGNGYTLLSTFPWFVSRPTARPIPTARGSLYPKSGPTLNPPLLLSAVRARCFESEELGLDVSPPMTDPPLMASPTHCPPLPMLRSSPSESNSVGTRVLLLGF